MFFKSGSNKKTIAEKNPFTIDTYGYSMLQVGADGTTVNNNNSKTAATKYSESRGAARMIGTDSGSGAGSGSGTGMNNLTEKDLRKMSLWEFLNGALTQMNISDLGRTLGKVNNIVETDIEIEKEAQKQQRDMGKTAGKDENASWLNGAFGYNLTSLKDTDANADVYNAGAGNETSNMKFAKGGGWLMAAKTSQNVDYKNDNEYIALARALLYEKKRAADKENKILNIVNVSDDQLLELGMVQSQINTLETSLTEPTITSMELVKIRIQIKKLQDKKYVQINKIVTDEITYDSTVGDHNNEYLIKPNDPTYIPFVYKDNKVDNNKSGFPLPKPMWNLF